MVAPRTAWSIGYNRHPLLGRTTPLHVRQATRVREAAGRPRIIISPRSRGLVRCVRQGVERHSSNREIVMHRGIAHLFFIVIGLGGCQGDSAPARARVHGSFAELVGDILESDVFRRRRAEEAR